MLIPGLIGLWATTISIFDIKERRIPNLLLILVFVPAVLALMIQGQGLLGARPWSSIGGLILGFALTLPGYVLHRFGAGDVKFAALLGLLLGTMRGLEMVLIASVLMGIAAAALLIVMKFPRDSKFPAAPMLAIGFAVEMLGGPFISA